MRMYVYTVMENDQYDTEYTFDDPIKAIELAMRGDEVAVLDALSLEFIGYIN